MTPRKRTTSRKGWPANLYPNRDGFKYRNPRTKAETYLGTDKAKAFAAAVKANAILMQANDLVSKITGTDKTVSDAIKVFRADDMPARKWAESTAAEYEIVLRKIERLGGSREVKSFDVRESATFIRSATDSVRGRQTLRLVLGWIFDGAVHEGWIDDNPIWRTRKFTFERQRERLTLDVYRAVWAAAPGWLQNAMDVSLLTLLRREDVATLKFADERAGALWVVPAKTEDSTLVKLKITVTDELAALLARCRDNVVSPYVVHRLPERARGRDKRAKGRDHQTQAMPDQITREFKKVRDSIGVTGKNSPTFHEVRSLGGALLMERGWTLEQVQALMGHASESMTKVYLEGHDTPWQAVTPGLSLPR